MKRVVLISVLCLGVGTTLAARASQQPTREHQMPAAGQQPDMKMCQDMAARHQKMMEEMKAMDARLDQEVKAMQAAQGQARVDAIARVVTTLVEQRTQMREKGMAMQAQASAHMMDHAGEGAGAMKQCPMMQQMMKGRPQ